MKKILTIFVTIIAVCSIFTSCGGGESDGTVENWFLLIIFMLAWLKGGK